MFVLVIFLLSFGNAVYIMNINRFYDKLGGYGKLIRDEDSVDLLVEPSRNQITGLLYLKSIWYQYQIMLGIADTDTEGEDEFFLITLVLISTFFITIIILNILIAIMSDVFNRNQADAHKKRIEVKLNLLSEYMIFVEKQIEASNKYLIIVQVIEDEDQASSQVTSGETASGRQRNSVSKSFEGVLQSLEQNFGKGLSKSLQQMALDNKTNFSQLDKSSKLKFKTMGDNVREVKTKVVEVEE